MPISSTPNPPLVTSPLEKNSSVPVFCSKEILIPSVGSISLDELEKQMVVKALEHHAYSISEAARALGITRSSLYRRIEKFGISV